MLGNEKQEANMNLSPSEKKLLHSKNLMAIAEFIGNRVIKDLPDFIALPPRSPNCDYQPDPEIGYFCAQYTGKSIGMDVMKSLVEANDSQFLMPEPPYVWDSNAGWYSTVWGVPESRYTFTLVYQPDWETADAPKIARLAISYTEDVKWDDLHSPR